MTAPLDRHRVSCQCAAVLALALSPAALAAVLHVDDDAPPGGDGSSWKAAYRFLQDALAAAGGGVTEIRVAQGTYAPDRSAASPGGTRDRAATFQLPSGVALLGGYAGIGAPDPDARDLEQFRTVLTGDLNGDDGPPDSFANNAENARNVVTASGTAPGTVLEGFTLTGGNADGPDQQDMLHLARGAGLWNDGGSPTVRNCRIEYNAAMKRGGGMYNYFATGPSVIGCTFTGNVVTTTGHGGGLRNFESNCTVSDCVFAGNLAQTGGGIDKANGTGSVTNCAFTGNEATFGGGISVVGPLAVTGCTFTGNSAAGGGGLYADWGGTPVVTGSEFCDNWASHISGNWTNGGGNTFCPLCDDSSGLVLAVPAVYPTIQSAINAACDGSEVVVAPGTYLERIVVGDKNIIVRSTDGPGATTIDGQGVGPVLVSIDSGTGLVLEGFTIANGFSELGGGAWIIGGSASLTGCNFRDNVADVGGAINWQAQDAHQLSLLRCQFDGNQANAGAGAIMSAGGHLTMVDCAFTDNDGATGPGAVGAAGSDASYVNCQFARNSASFVAGGMADGSGTILMANCVFSRNSAPMSGGLESVNSAGMIINCTFSLNQGDGVGNSPPLANCILWGNTPGQIAAPSTVVQHSDVQGGWPGAGNIDADPLFVQPVTDDVRLSFGSPCVDAGSNAALPADGLDLDGDGNVAEPIPFDIGGAPRVVGGAVDMGAWEGEFEPGAPASSVGDLDQGGFAVLVPEGTTFNPLAGPAVIVVNTSGPDNASFTVVQLDAEIHPGAGGFTELGSILRTETSLADGEYIATLYIPFDAGDLGGADPAPMNLTWFDEAAGNWAIATSANSQVSPGFNGPVGNRVMSLQGGGWGVTSQVGDYGVVWVPQIESGFVWANVDRAADFAAGFAFCPMDCRQTPDGSIGIQDLLALLNQWGAAAGGGPCDADFDGVIDQADLVQSLGAWGPCTAGSAAGSSGDGAADVVTRRTAASPDLDGNERVGPDDLEALKSAWGTKGNGPADLDGDGGVTARDLLLLLQGWGAKAPP